MKTLVTGGAGFIGSHLVRRLLDLGHQVRVLDDLSPGSPDNLPVDPALELVVGHIADKDVVESALEGQDAFVHLAAVASVQASVEDPLGTHRTNLEGSIRLFETAARLQVRRAVYASSAAVYGDNPSLPLSETAEKRLGWSARSGSAAGIRRRRNHRPAAGLQPGAGAAARSKTHPGVARRGARPRRSGGPLCDAG